jgi:hypothetical protein
VKPGTISLYLIIISMAEKSPSSARMREDQLRTHPGNTMEDDPHAEVEVDSYYQICGQLENMFLLIRKWSANPVISPAWLLSLWSDSNGCRGTVERRGS